MRGRQAPGPEFVQRLQGDAAVKRRLEVILSTVAGRRGVSEAAALLGITPQRFHALRQQALQAAVAALAPRPGGRPRRVATPPAEPVAELVQENERLRHELAACQLREEIALLLPGRAGPGEKKSGRGGHGRGRRPGERGAGPGGRRVAGQPPGGTPTDAGGGTARGTDDPSSQRRGRRGGARQPAE
jgi:hypothetical protein